MASCGRYCSYLIDILFVVIFYCLFDVLSTLALVKCLIVWQYFCNIGGNDCAYSIESAPWKSCPLVLLTFRHPCFGWQLDGIINHKPCSHKQLESLMHKAGQRCIQLLALSAALSISKPKVFPRFRYVEGCWKELKARNRAAQLCASICLCCSKTIFLYQNFLANARETRWELAKHARPVNKRCMLN